MTIEKAFCNINKPPKTALISSLATLSLSHYTTRSLISDEYLGLQAATKEESVARVLHKGR